MLQTSYMQICELVLLLILKKIIRSCWQRVSNSFNMVDKLDATCGQYGMNAKKTKKIVEKTPWKQCEVNVKGQKLTQVKEYQYMGTTLLLEHRECKTEQKE